MDTVLIAVFVIVPGFTYLEVASFSVAPDKERNSDFETIASSISLSAILLAFELLFVAIISLVWSDLRHDLDSIAKNGVGDYVQHHSSGSLAVACLLTIGNTTLLAFFAWSQVIDSFLAKSAASRSFSFDTPWVTAIEELSKKLQRDQRLGIRVYLASGAEYHGAYAGVSSVGHGGAGPDIAIWDPKYRSTEDAEWTDAGSAVVLPAVRIERFELYGSEQEEAVTPG